MTRMTRTATGFPTIRLSHRTRELLDQVVAARRGQQVLILHSCCAAPTVVRVIPERDFRPRPTQVRVATLFGHPVWADEAELRTCPHESLIIVPISAHLGRLQLIVRAYDPEEGRRP